MKKHQDIASPDSLWEQRLAVLRARPKGPTFRLMLAIYDDEAIAEQIHDRSLQDTLRRSGDEIFEPGTAVLRRYVLH